MTARWHKILAHYHLDRYDYSFWIDANYEIVGAFSPLFDRLAATTCLATHKHPVRDCAYAEAEEIKGAGMERCEIVDLQMEYYRSLGFPARSGLIESGVLFRAHNDSRVEAMMRDWWDQVDTFSQRDQLSANYVFWKHRFAYDELPWPSRASEYLRYHPHPRTANYIEAESVAKALERLRDAGQDRRRPRVAESRQAL